MTTHAAGRRRGPPRSLRVRLVTVLVAVLTLAFGAAALVTVLVVRHVLLDRLDAQLHAAGDRFAVGLEHDDHDADNGRGRYGNVEGQLAGTLGARLYHGQVTAAAVVGDHDTSDRVPTAARSALARLTATTHPRSVSLTGLGTYRIIVVAGRDGDLQVTGLPAEPVEDTIEKLVLTEGAVFAGTLLLVALVSTGLVRLMLRPLTRIAHTADEIAELPLDTGGGSLPHRVSVDGAGSEVDTVARAFNAMLAQVEGALVTRADSEDRLRRFIADASHELRTPVAVVRSHAELALRSADGTELPTEVVRSLTRITAQSERMGHLVEDLLLLARLDAGRPLTHEPVDVVRMVLDAVDDARVTDTDHRWQLHLPARSIWVHGDAHALAQAVSNLLANAAAHTPKGTTVAVSVSDPAPDDAGTIRVSVVDDGPGMSADLAAHAFDRFVRGGNQRTVSRGSSGLGLPIVSAIVTAHGGRVALRSDGSGTAVDLDLPTASRDRGSAVAGDPDPTDPADTGHDDGGG